MIFMATECEILFQRVAVSVLLRGPEGTDQCTMHATASMTIQRSRDICLIIKVPSPYAQDSAFCMLAMCHVSSASCYSQPGALLSTCPTNPRAALAVVLSLDETFPATVCCLFPGKLDGE